MKSREGGFYYEINKKHPIVDALVQELGDSKQIYALLTQIEKSIPLNQLYIDLNNDEHVENDRTQEEVEIEKAIIDMLPQAFSDQEKIAFLDKLMDIPPYKDYQEVFDKVKKEIKEHE